MKLSIVKPSDFKRLQDADLLPGMTTLGHHIAHALTYWQDAETEEERDRWAAYLAKCVANANRVSSR